MCNVIQESLVDWDQAEMKEALEYAGPLL